MPKYKVCKVNEFGNHYAAAFEIEGHDIAVYCVDGTFYAIHNACPHEGGPLGEGHVKGFVVSCPWHDLSFDVRNGQGTDGGGYCVGSYEVRVRDDDLFIGPRRKV